KVLELYPEVNLKGVTWGWLKSGIDTTRGAMKSDAKNVTANIKMFRAKPDDLVDADAEDTVCNAINKGGKGTCDLKTFDTAKHEVWNERDEIRDVVLTDALAFYKSKM